ncbi:hypothetical protein [Cohnella mopanensis]|uniref:hypothetical protein n=1 Tax=Cohnella mopanensis TaxID=2911966 RepID=UPI001EF9AD89|nr:hypothetical protein [Cohnella mopanensis]
MTKKHSKTAMAMSVAVLTLVLMGTACSSNNSNSTPSASPSSSASSSPSSSGALETESASPSAEPETITDSGKYVGLQDSHSIEITTDKGSMAFQVSPEIAEKVDLWEEDTAVKFQYKTETLEANGEKIEQRTIVSIDKQ